MNDRLALQRLWWKELRQLLPMLLLLPALALVLLGLYLLSGNIKHDATAAVIFTFGMPGLFAVGAGALLVGQEKELRTIQWLAGLPIPPRRIVRVKVAASLVGLVILWGISALVYAAAVSIEPRLPAELSWETWPSHSLYVLLAGFALAWWANSALVALLLVVPVSLIPPVIAYGIDSWWPWQQATAEIHSHTTLLVCQLACSAIALGLSDRLGQRNLAPAATGPASPSDRVLALDRYRSASQRAGYGQVQSPYPALIWQFAMQIRGWLLGNIALLAAALIIVTLGDHRWVPLAILAAFLATSWLGVSVFQSDTSKGQIRFLADRGIAPRAIWMTRHAIPASILAVFVLALVLISVALLPEVLPPLGRGMIAMPLYGFALALIYLVTHWAGQTIASPIVSAVAAPLIALAAIAYGSFAVVSLGMPWWLAPLVLLIPPIATLTMTRRWMDRRLGLSYWASHGGFLTATLLIPAVPLLISLARQPAMPADVARELAQVAEANRGFVVKTHELVLGNGSRAPQEAPPRTSPPVVSLAALWEQQLDQVDDQLQALPTAVGLGTSGVRVIDLLKNVAVLTRMSLQSPAGAANDSETSDPQQAQRIHRRSIDLLSQIARRMRVSPHLIDQDTADLLEIWLLRELRRPGARPLVGEPLYDTVAAVLADQASRNRARRRALALSWQRYQDESSTSNFPVNRLGGYELESLQSGSGTLGGKILTRRRAGRAVSELWQLAQGGEQAVTPERLSRLARLVGRPAGSYGIGPAGDYLRADDVDRLAIVESASSAPASQWFAGWEQQAVELNSQRSP